MAQRPLLPLLLCLLLLPAALCQSTSWSYCYYIVGTANSVSYITSVSGSLTTSSVAVAVNGRSAYNVTAISGSRVYSDSTGRSSTTAISGVAPIANNASSVDQVVYTDWPSVDSLGLQYQFTGTAQTPFGPATGGVIRLFVDAVNPAYSELIARTRFNELLSVSNGSTSSFDSTGGDFVLVNDGGASATAGTIANQCSLTYGTSTTYSFCYYAATDSSSNAASTYTVLSSGTLTATGPVTRRGRTAYIVQSATGTRTLTTGITASTPAGTAQQQRIVGVRSVDADEVSGFVYNDDAIFLSAPYLDDEGVVFVLDGNAIFPTKTVATTDVQLYRGDIARLYNEITPFTPAPAYDYGFISSNTSYVQFSSSASAATLAAAKCQYNAAATLPSHSTAVALACAMLMGVMLAML